MSLFTFTIARDYNRGLIAPVRWVHSALGLFVGLFGPWVRWVRDPRRSWWAVPTAGAMVLAAVLLRLDGPIARRASEWRLGGDLRRELETIQQFGQGASLVVIMAAIWLLDRAGRRRLFDLAAAAASTGLLVLFLKMAVGRPRPRPAFNDPFYFLGPLGAYPISEKAGVRHAWEFWGSISSDLWSMPSSHTAYAVVTAIFLTRMYPRIKPLVYTLATVVGVARVWVGAHYPTDVLVGALVACTLAPRAVDECWGQRLVARLANMKMASRTRVRAANSSGNSASHAG